jgi:hypothetical protein
MLRMTYPSAAGVPLLASSEDAEFAHIKALVK